MEEVGWRMGRFVLRNIQIKGGIEVWVCGEEYCIRSSWGCDDDDSMIIFPQSQLVRLTMLRLS
jgi:hypothetical protein